MMKKGLLSGRCYHAMGSWLADYVFFVRNQHPILSMFFVPKVNEYSGKERRNCEFATLGYCFVVSAMLGLGSGEGNNDAVAAFFALTLPSMILHKTLFYINACPCLLTKQRRSGLAQVGVSLVEGCGHLVTNFLLWITVLEVIVGIAIASAQGNSGFLMWFIVGRSQAWVVWFFTSILLAFNPWGVFPAKSGLVCGTWLLEKATAEVKGFSEESPYYRTEAFLASARGEAPPLGEAAVGGADVDDIGLQMEDGDEADAV